MANMIHHHDAIVRTPTPTTEFNEYPKLMSHPAFTLGQAAQEVKHPGGRIEYVGGTSVRFPPVTVTNADDEAWYAARGYVSQGKSDAQAFAQAVASAKAAQTPVGYVRQEYPKWAGGVLVQNAEEEEAALAARRSQLGIIPSGPSTAALVERGDERETVLDVWEPEPLTPPAPPADPGEVATLRAQLAELQQQMCELLAAQKVSVPLLKPAKPKPAAKPKSKPAAPPEDKAAN